jgi:cytochrome b561
MWFGNILLVGVLGIYAAYFKKNKISLLYFLPLPWILLTSINQENTFWGMASIQNFGIVFLSLWAFWELEEERLINALVLVSIAVFTSGNGFVTLAIMGGFLLLKQQWKNLGILVLLGVLLAFLYFATYQKPPATPSATLADLKKVLLAFVSFAGSAADVSLDTAISVRTIKAIFLGDITHFSTDLCC